MVSGSGVSKVCNRWIPVGVTPRSNCCSPTCTSKRRSRAPNGRELITRSPPAVLPREPGWKRFNIQITTKNMAKTNTNAANNCMMAIQEKGLLVSIAGEVAAQAKGLTIANNPPGSQNFGAAIGENWRLDGIPESLIAIFWRALQG